MLAFRHPLQLTKSQEKEAENTTLKPLFSYLFFKILSTNNWVFGQS